MHFDRLGADGIRFERIIRMAIRNEDVSTLIELFEASSWDTMTLDTGELKLVLSKSGAMPGTVSVSASPSPAAASASASARPAEATPAPAPVAAPATGALIVHAPNMGIFWKQPKPGAPPYVAIGDRITPDTTLCLVEVMKLFTQVKAGLSGRLVRCLVEDGAMIEEGTPLFELAAE
jgi:acetyl-CoA carboxylase biotin carboxyl carrier protein